MERLLNMDFNHPFFFVICFKKLGTLVCIVLSVCFTTFSQTSGKIVKGRVVGDDNEPLAGASVMVAGSKKGAQTGNNENFTLSVPNNGEKHSLPELISKVSICKIMILKSRFDRKRFQWIPQMSNGV